MAASSATAPDWIDALGSAWRREYRGVDTGALPPLVRLARLAVLLETFESEVLRPFELARSDYGVLAMLRRAGPPYELSPSQLTSELDRSSGGMTKILKRLEEAGLVTRLPDPDDGRGSRVSLTKAGLELQDRVFHAFLAASQAVLAPLSAAKLREADRALRALLGAFEDHLAGGGDGS
jgi:DNA-binding MarR family transcriptional regulator